jgi:tetratricopeptide (TPR) repeat protein
MGNDYRPDHSFRIPRPDLSRNLGTPNACNRCHTDQSNQWSNDYFTKWYGPGRRVHYGTTIDTGRQRFADAYQDLIRLAGDPLYPVIVRATALSLLGAYPAAQTSAAYELALVDDEALIRRTAVDHLNVPDLKRQTALLASALYDPVKAVRTEAAQRMTEIPTPGLDADEQKVFQKALGEYQQSLEYSADFAFGRYNLGNLYANLRQPEKAIENYRAAVRIDNQFYPAKVNLAMLFNQMGRKDEAEMLLREVVAAQSELYEVQYSLGLLLAEKNEFGEAAQYLAMAAAGLPDRSRVHYNLGLLLQHLKRDSEAEAALLTSLEIEPDNLDYLYALADHYLKRQKLVQARRIAEQMIARHPDKSIGFEILNFVVKHPAARKKP